MRFVRFCLSLLFAVLTLGTPVCAEEPAWFGATVETVTPALMAERGLAMPFGALVTAVEPDSPAAKAGFAEGDVILSVNDTGVRDAAEFEAEFGKLAVGATAKLHRMRGKEPASVTVTLAEKPKPREPQIAGTSPLLMLDTGGHMASIVDVVFTPDGRQLVSASDDKTIRVWDLETGKTVRFIRGESSQGSPGKIFAMALSPDGKWLAAGGFLCPPEDFAAEECAEPIRLYDFASGRIVALLKGHENVVNSLAFSPDSKYLISGSFDHDAIIWDAATRTLKHRLRGHKDDIYAVGFTPDSARAITGSYDHDLRLWSVADGSEIARMTGHQDKVQSLAVAPDGRIASGDWSGEIRLWEGKTGAFLKVLAQQKGSVGSLSFSPDGKYLLSSCGGGRPGSDTPENVFDAKTGELVVVYDKHDNIVIATAVSPDGRWAATGGGDNQEIHIWELKSGKPRLRDGGEPLILKGNGQPAWAAAFSKNGRRIAWGNTWTGNGHVSSANSRLEHALTLPVGEGQQVLGRPEPLRESDASLFRRAERTHGTVSLSHRKGGDYGYDAILDVKDGDQILASIERGSTDGYEHSAYTFSPDGTIIISAGANGVIAAYDLDGKNIGGFVGHTSDIWAATPSPDGRYLVSGSDDQTVRLWNLKTRELIVTLFYGADGEWVMWTPQGYYTGSPGGGELVGWQINQGNDKEASYVRGRQLRDKLLRPDIVERAVQLASAEAAIEEAGLEKVSVETLLAQSPPLLHAKAWEPQATGGHGIVLVAVEKNALPVLDTRITVSDGKQETTVKARSVDLPGGAPRGDQGVTLSAYEVPLFKGQNTVRIVARNAAGESEPQEAIITHNGDGALDKRGTLWVLAVGVNDYPGAQHIAEASTGKEFAYKDLKYAGADAEAFAATTAGQMQAQHTKTDVTVLVNGGKDGDPTRKNILDALQRISSSSSDTDTIVILLAGHGENWKEGGRYHFLPTDFARTSMSDIGENVIDWQHDVQPAIAGAKGRKILFVDACHSGNARNQTLLARAEADRFVAFSSAGPGQDALELEELKHGVFTYVVIEALTGADEALDRRARGVTVYKLGDYLFSEVSARTLGKQEPEFRSGQGNLVLTRN